MRVLITGAMGFIGNYLTGFLARNGDDVWGTYYADEKPKRTQFAKNVRHVKCDIRDVERVYSLISQVKPERIYHLAAQSFPTTSWKEPVLTFEANAIGTINLFQSVLVQKIKPKILVACSSAEYGFISEKDVPVREDHSLMPLHPYGVSKVAQDLLAYQYFVNFGVFTVRVRIFNVTGPGKTGDVLSDFARRIVNIEKGEAPPVLKVGNLQSRRDMTDVRDAVKGLYLALERGKAGDVYNLCSGEAHQISELLRTMLSLAKKSVKTEVDPSLLRPSDEPIIMGSNEKLHKQTGWRSTIPIRKTVEDILNYWRQHQE